MTKAVLAIEPEVAPLEAFGPAATPVVAAVTAPVTETPTRAADFFELTKPKIAVMALFTVGIGSLLAGTAGGVVTLVHTLVGAGLVAAGGSALNQWLERKIDAKMRRTLNRPLPAGRLTPVEAFTFGVVLTAVGLVYLALTVHVAAVVAAAVTAVSYVLIYTPMKTWTVWNTVVGAVPGALPPVIGWCAVRGWDGAAEVAGLFLILFFWQLPHFLAIAWMYRDDYARGGLRMLPIIDPSGGRTAWAMVVTAALLIAACLVPVFVGMAGAVYAAGAVLLGLMFVWRGEQFRRDRTDRRARRVLRASLLYLPGVLGLLMIDALLL